MISPDGASAWGQQPDPPFAMVGRRTDRHRALQQRKDRTRCAEERETCTHSSQYDDYWRCDDENATSLSRQQDMEEWSTQRWGGAQEHVGENFSREEFLEEGYVAESRGGAREGDAHHVMNMRTPSPGADASSRTPSPDTRPPVPDRGSILGTYRDTPVERIDRSVKPSGSYLVIDGVWGGRRQPDVFPDVVRLLRSRTLHRSGHDREVIRVDYGR